MQEPKIITSAAKINIPSWSLMEELGFKKTGEKLSSTYIDENNNRVECFTYECNKDMFLNRNDNDAIKR